MLLLLRPPLWRNLSRCNWLEHQFPVTPRYASGTFPRQPPKSSASRTPSKAARFTHTKMATRKLTADDYRRLEAHNAAWIQALGEVKEYNAELVSKALQAVAEEHPIEDKIREAYIEEISQRFVDPLRALEETLSHHTFNSDAPWGLLIYRVAYGDDVAWERMLDLLRREVKSIHDQPINQHLFPRHRFEVVEDRSQLEGATLDQLHDMFSKWVIDEYRRNCKDSERPSIEEIVADERGKMYGYSYGARYNFFLVVDEVCLESMDQKCGPVVKIVQRATGSGKSYSAEEIEEMGPIQEDSAWEGGVTENDLENVGWMYMEVDDYVTLLDDLSQPGDWEDLYLRPPQMRWQDGFEDAPGSWRRKALSAPE